MLPSAAGWVPVMRAAPAQLTVRPGQSLLVEATQARRQALDETVELGVRHRANELRHAAVDVGAQHGVFAVLLEAGGEERRNPRPHAEELPRVRGIAGDEEPRFTVVHDLVAHAARSAPNSEVVVSTSASTTPSSAANLLFSRIGKFKGS